MRPELVVALESNNSIAAEQLRHVLQNTGRLSALYEAYAETRVVAPLMREWHKFAAGRPTEDDGSGGQGLMDSAGHLIGSVSFKNRGFRMCLLTWRQLFISL